MVIDQPTFPINQFFPTHSYEQIWICECNFEQSFKFGSVNMYNRGLVRVKQIVAMCQNILMIFFL